MTKNETEVTKNRNSIGNEPNDKRLGFMADFVEEASVGDENTAGSKMFYKKLDKDLVVESNNYKRSIKVYISSASQEDKNQLLNYILPKNKY